MADGAEERKSLQVDDYMGIVLEQGAAIAWQKLGLQPDIVTGAIEQDLEQAKTIIDFVAHTAEFVEPRLDESDRREVQNLVRNLRINYVERARG